MLSILLQVLVICVSLFIGYYVGRIVEERENIKKIKRELERAEEEERVGLYSRYIERFD